MEEDSIDSLVQLVLPLCLVPSPPVNVSAVLSVNCSTNQSTLTVEWSPPLYNNTAIEKYYIELYSAETKILSELISPVSGVWCGNTHAQMYPSGYLHNIMYLCGREVVRTQVVQTYQFRGVLNVAFRVVFVYISPFTITYSPSTILECMYVYMCS